MKLAYVTSHPIQYQVPVFRELAKRSDIEFLAMYAMIPDAATQGDGFGVEFEWDLPLLSGYESHVLQNESMHPSVTRFSGCDTPTILSSLRGHQVDVVVVNGWVVKTCLQALRSCRKLNIPCLVRGEANHLRPRPYWKRFLQRRLVRKFDACLAIGIANRHFYESYGVPKQEIFDSPYCVENSRFTSEVFRQPEDRFAFRDQIGITPDATCFLYCGKFEAKKHPLELLDAFKNAVQSMRSDRPIHLLMVGDGAMRKECQNFANDHRLPCSFTGFLNQTEIVRAYSASDCLVLPSDHGETWGLVVNEAMAAGLPAIVSDQVGCRQDLIETDRTGFTFRFGDWNALTELFVKAAKARDQLKIMGQYANQRIASYSPSAAACGIAQAAHWVHRASPKKRAI
ncbi:glycosyltransferase [Roseiconus sp. JC912]